MIPYTSAHSRKMKMAVLVEEGLRNHTRGLEWERSRKVMEDWSRKLRRSGYPATMRHEVIKAALDRYNDPTAGDMTKDMKAVCRDFEMVTGWRIPVVERAGKAMRSMAKAEPLKKKGCERDDCFPCTTGGGNCERNGSGYRICCLGCLRAGRCTEYDGETGNNGYTRGKEQADGLRLESEENALWKHCMIEHEGQHVEFSMKVLESFQSAMARQVNEGVRIKRSKADCVMNSKSEFHQHPVVRVVPMRGIQQEQGEEQRGGRGRGQRGRGQRRQGQ